MQKPREIKGSPHFIDHKRHKTKNVMRLWITLPPIGGLIFILKRLVAHTHPKIAYLSREELLLTEKQLEGKKTMIHTEYLNTLVKTIRRMRIFEIT